MVDASSSNSCLHALQTYSYMGIDHRFLRPNVCNPVAGSIGSLPKTRNGWPVGQRFLPLGSGRGINLMWISAAPSLCWSPPTLAYERTVDGLINLNKPTGITSAKALYRVRSITRQRKSGHAGTSEIE